MLDFAVNLIKDQVVLLEILAWHLMQRNYSSNLFCIYDTLDISFEASEFD